MLVFWSKHDCNTESWIALSSMSSWPASSFACAISSVCNFLAGRFSLEWHKSYLFANIKTKENVVTDRRHATLIMLVSNMVMLFSYFATHPRWIWMCILQFWGCAESNLISFRCGRKGLSRMKSCFMTSNATMKS